MSKLRAYLWLPMSIATLHGALLMYHIGRGLVVSCIIEASTFFGFVALSILYALQEKTTYGRTWSPSGNSGSETGSESVAFAAIAHALPVIADPRAGARSPHPGIKPAYTAYQKASSSVDLLGGCRELWESELALHGASLDHTQSVQPIIAYRIWRTGTDRDPHLHSMFQPDKWNPGEPMTGTVHAIYPWNVSGDHGFDSVSSLLANYYVDLFGDYPDTGIVVGTVSLWGTVIICEKGYRAEYGYPQALCWSNYGDAIVQQLARTYGCEYRPASAARKQSVR